jgi:hypothetical protein
MAMTRLGVFLLLCSLAVLGCPSGDGGATIGGDEPEQVQLPQIKVNLPAPPSFQKDHAPERYTDSSYSVYGLRKDIKNLLGKKVKVKGFLIEVYECPPAPKGSTDKPCDKPHLFLGDRSNSPKEEALIITDYPKQDEKSKSKKKQEYTVGAQYIFGGTFSRSSGTGFSHSEGLLIYSEGNKVSE